ncbi:MAG: hypothetical protein JST94_11710 [Bacteroidetes bacterium]|nr:hypothetical protein [Bacteroidota bacterium]MBS1672092.1 hypothetical protein [Bacteroidota bacterium]
MKQLSLLIIAMFFLKCLYSQKHSEYNIAVGTGLFKYAGTDNTYIEPYYSSVNTNSVAITAGGKGYANNPHGNKAGFSYFILVGMKKITKRNFLWRYSISYESVESKKSINWLYDGFSYYKTLGGECLLRNQFITLSPNYGYRFTNKKNVNVYCDITGGLDIAMNFFNAHEKTYAITATNNTVTNDDLSRTNGGFHPLDVRANLQAEIGYNRWGIIVDYTWGFFTGINTTIGSTPEVNNSRFLKFGLSYQLKSTKNKKPHNS